MSLLHQRLNLIARLRLLAPDASRETANHALNELLDDGQLVGLAENFNLPRRTLAAMALVGRPLTWLDDLLDEMGVPA